jgi:hypothetical protein
VKAFGLIMEKDFPLGIHVMICEKSLLESTFINYATREITKDKVTTQRYEPIELFMIIAKSHKKFSEVVEALQYFAHTFKGNDTARFRPLLVNRSGISNSSTSSSKSAFDSCSSLITEAPRAVRAVAAASVSLSDELSQ